MARFQAYSGYADFEFYNLTLFLSAFADPYYAQVIAPDEKTFLDQTGAITATANTTFGAVKPVVADGKIVKEGH